MARQFNLKMAALISRSMIFFLYIFGIIVNKQPKRERKRYFYMHSILSHKNYIFIKKLLNQFFFLTSLNAQNTKQFTKLCWHKFHYNRLICQIASLLFAVENWIYWNAQNVKWNEKCLFCTQFPLKCFHLFCIFFFGCCW